MKHIKEFQSFKLNEAEETSGLLKELPGSIEKLDDIESMLLTLAKNGAIYHFDDDAKEITDNGKPLFTEAEADKINELMTQAFDMAEKKLGKDGFWNNVIKDVFLNYITFSTNDNYVYMVKGSGGKNMIKKIKTADYNDAITMFKNEETDEYDAEKVGEWFDKLRSSNINEKEDNSEADDISGKYKVGKEFSINTMSGGPVKLDTGDSVSVSVHKLPGQLNLRHNKGLSTVKKIDVEAAIKEEYLTEE